MRFVLYNIRYGTGDRPFLLPWSGYLRRTGVNLQRIIRFVAAAEPDIVGLVEVDGGSYRSGRVNQARALADALGHFHLYGSKYGEGAAAKRLPVWNKQGNALLCRDSIRRAHFHYFDCGMKRLVLEIELADLRLFLVHLSLGFRARHRQLTHLYDLVRGTDKPCVVAGDFNAAWGESEIRLFLAATGLVDANAGGQPSYPSWAPRRHLDFILHSPGIHTRQLLLPRVTFSDHLPLVWDFDLGTVQEAGGA
jgi:endonuclease/exonuclease/phosphatase family metal-dependent hydrolase